MKSLVSLCMIVRNEEANLPDCLASVRDLVEEIIVVDTGSTDRTREVAAQLGAKVHDFPWTDDFAAARNHSRSLATGEWIFWMDADDRVDRANHHRLAGLFASLRGLDPHQNLAFFMTIRCREAASRSCLCHMRLFPNAARLAWFGRVHEGVQPIDPGGRIELRGTEICIDHIGYSDPQAVARKNQRNLRLLQLDCADRPSAANMFFLGRAYFRQGQYADALRLLRQSVDNGTSTCTNSAHAMICRCLFSLGRRMEALTACRAAMAAHGESIDLLHEYAGMLLNDGQLPEAEAEARRLLDLPQWRNPFVHIDCTVQKEEAHFLLGFIHQARRLRDAETDFRAALTLCHNFADAWFALGQLYLSQGQYNELEWAVEGLCACGSAQSEATLLRAQLHLARGRFVNARRLLAPLLAAQPDWLWPQIVLCDLLYREGYNRGRCIELHRRVLERDPSQVDIQSRLEMLLQMEDVAVVQ